MLSEDERRTLEKWVKRRGTARDLAMRARIVIACARGGSNLAVAAQLGANRHGQQVAGAISGRPAGRAVG